LLARDFLQAGCSSCDPRNSAKAALKATPAVLYLTRTQEIIERYGLENILMGMTSQLSEREDHVIVDDLRGEQ